MESHLDHVVITAPTLAAGIDYVYGTLGVLPQAGGEHVRMGTHNALLKLGGRTYLEVIAIDPDAATPARPRWFALDAPGANPAPRLAAWLARTNDIAAAASASPVPLGTIQPMSRGETHWQITIPEDGALPLGGAAPMLIQWRDRHPTDTLEDRGCDLLGLELAHADANTVADVLAGIGLRTEVSVNSLNAGEPAGVRARFKTPAGERELNSRGAADGRGRQSTVND